MARVLHVLPHRGGGAERFIDLLERMPGHEHERVVLSSGRDPVRSAPSIASRWTGVAREARRHDLVHLHGDVAVSLALPWAARRRFVWTTHGLHFLRRASGAKRAVVERSLKTATARARATTCCSHAEREELEAIGASGELVVIHNGIDPTPPADPNARAMARRALSLSESEVVAVFVGELEERKGPLLAARAAQRAGVTLLVAGTGPLEEPMRAQEDEHVRVLGFRRDVPELLAAADIFVMPSEREGISFAVLEAMGASLAMVVSDGPGNPEAVGDAGVVFPVGDEQALIAALADLREHPERRRGYGRAARERVERAYTAQRLVDDMAAVYVRALGPDGGAAPA